MVPSEFLNAKLWRRGLADVLRCAAIGKIAGETPTLQKAASCGE
jgi:hypothetical protein